MGLEPYIGEITMFGGNFAPRGWALCNGQLLSIAQNTALFSILGTTYGGDGVTTFGLPNLQGRVAIHSGNSNDWQLGQAAGSSTVTLTVANLPAHGHTLAAASAAGDNPSPTNNVLGTYGADMPPSGPYSSGKADTALNAQAVGQTGGNLPVEVQNPYLCVNFIIATEGVFPSRG